MDGNWLKEYCSLCDFIVKKEYSEKKHHRNNNFWWDVENDFFVFFDHTNKILATMDFLEKTKFGYDETEPKAAFSGLRLKILEEKNQKPHLATVLGNTLINKYKYDEENRIHFIEFSKDSYLENILMEAMLISKVDLGQVVFGINNKDFNINSENSLIKIINQSGINLEDKIENSKTIIQLEKDFNNKKESQRKLCYILRQIADKNN